ncbi:Hypothetical protein NTJ_05697 [Nesidiocoris tenuis]|uniref:Uncharacterized protein n=1 Tax=Nesidiocoris tenuis TaxID=355587 RepID=A0ABN7ALR4_9HEMI|nr:Hypothetical protein NTJ_05697 [Nesidiocoris tenuis]
MFDKRSRTSEGDDGGSEGVETLDEARKVIRELRERHRMLSHQLLSWRRRLKAQEDHIARTNVERNEQLRKLSMQLLLFESRLCRKQRDISNLLTHRENIIAKQQKIIRQLQRRLSEAGVEPQLDDGSTNLDSLNDSDSAVIMEDDDPSIAIPFGHNGVTIVRSVSDALEVAAPNNNKYSMLRRSNCFLRRPEILETVYSVEEDPDADGNVTPTPQDDHLERSTSSGSLNQLRRPPRLKDLSGSFERLDHRPHDIHHYTDDDSPPPLLTSPQPQVTTYNRVMSNHRSVTKPKDVKYKRINKAKSKSLEELRGRLKNWVEKGNKISVSLEQSFN